MTAGTSSEGFSHLLRTDKRKRLPVIRQIESSECALACLAMILGWHGQHMSLGELRARFPSSAKGSTLGDLIRCADAAGLVCRPVRAEMEEIGELQLPCILHWNLDHFVVLSEVRKGAIRIHDPASGARTVTLNEASAMFTGVAVELATGPAFQRKTAAPALSLRKLAGSVRGVGSSLRNILGFAVALEVISLLMPQFLQVTVDQVLADADHDLLTLLGCGFMLLVVVQAVISAFRTWSVVWLSTHFTMNWTGNVFQHLMRLPHAYFLKRHLGDLVSRMAAIGVIQQSLTSELVAALIDGLMALATFVLLLVYSPLLTCIIVSGTAVYVCLRLAYFRTFQEANLSQITVNARQQSSLMEALRGVQTIRLNNQGPARAARYLNHTADALNTQVEVQRLQMVFGLMNALTSGIQRIGVLWLGAVLALKGQMSAGMLMAFASYSEQFTGRANAFAEYLIQVRLLRLQGERLADIVLTPPEPGLVGQYQGPVPEASLRFENVSFRYSDSGPWILKNCSFEIGAGSAVAIVGPSGCGKTTLLQLILGLLEPQAGRILVGEVELAHLGKAAFRDMIGAVLQEDRLFAGSVSDNISFFSEAGTTGDIETAARAAQIHDDICAMPMGYHTHVGDMGSSLSGGQRQRLHLARALYRKPSVLVLDEATSHLDIPNEKKIASVLRDMAVTRIIVAHRPETVATADRVLALADGAIHDLAPILSGLKQAV